MIRGNVRESFFEVLLNNERSKVIGWLKKKYSSFSFAECEDIFQEGSIVLWEKFMTMLDMNENDFGSMLFSVCRNISTHHLRKVSDTVVWDDCYYPHETQVEADYCYVGPEVARMMMKERMYDEISRLSPKDQAVIKGYILGKRMKEIAREAELKSEQSAKNKKIKIVVRLRNAINGQASQDACPSSFKYMVRHYFPFIINLRIRELRISEIRTKSILFELCRVATKK